jgi:hypothetical protein
MGSIALHFNGISLAWNELRQKLARAREPGCDHACGMWRRLKPNPPSVVLSGVRYCIGSCLEPALSESIVRARPVPQQRMARHRVPLGLLLLSRQQITAAELASALDAQQNAGQGKIGEWLLALGSVTQQQITAALARQWRCPILRTGLPLPSLDRLPLLPLALMQSTKMIPIGYSRSSSSLHLAFSEGIDYNVLYAIEQMTGFHTQGCLATPDLVQARIAAFSNHNSGNEVVFECGTDTPEFARIVRSYCARVCPSEVRIAVAGYYTWVRLVGPRPTLDLLFRSSNTSTED